MFFLSGLVLHLFLLSKADNDATASTSPAFLWREVIIQILIMTTGLFVLGYVVSKAFINDVSWIERIILSFAIAPALMMFTDFFIIGAVGAKGFETNETLLEASRLIAFSFVALIVILIKKLKTPKTLNL